MDHGTACAVTLPHVIDYNYDCAKEAYEELAEALEPGSGKKLSQIVSELEQKVGIATMKDAGIAEDQLEFLAEEAMKEDLGPNPKQDVTKEDILEILKKAYK